MEYTLNKASGLPDPLNPRSKSPKSLSGSPSKNQKEARPFDATVEQGETSPQGAAATRRERAEADLSNEPVSANKQSMLQEAVDLHEKLLALKERVTSTSPQEIAVRERTEEVLREADRVHHYIDTVGPGLEDMVNDLIKKATNKLNANEEMLQACISKMAQLPRQ